MSLIAKPQESGAEQAPAPESNLWDIRWTLVPYTRGYGLEVSPGQTGRLFPHFQKIGENIAVRSLDEFHLIASQSCDFVFVEYEDPTKEMIEEWWRVIKQNGYLCLMHPSEYVKGLYGLDEQLSKPVYVYQKYTGAKRARAEPATVDKRCLVLRFGAFGDMLQVSSIFPALKAEGYHLTVATVPRGYEIVSKDPSVDEWILIDDKQIPPGNLGEYCEWLATKYDKFINMSESVEGTLLPASDRPSFFWPQEVRHVRMNLNYVEFQHHLAGLSYSQPNSKFYPSAEERNKAMREAQRMGRPIILWSLAGSGPHKVWPHMDAVIARILTTWPNAHIILAGDKSCQMLEEPWKNEKRVHRTSGNWSIRETLSFAQTWADIVIGPETGVLNAVAMEPNAKIVLLSHSSHENLTRDWINTYALFSTKTPCYPCHQLHKTFQYCPQDEVYGTSLCQAELPADAVWAAITQVMEEKKVA